MAVEGDMAKVDTRVASPNTGALPCSDAHVDGVASPIHWHFDGGFGNGVTYALNPLHTIGRRKPELLPSSPFDMIV